MRWTLHRGDCLDPVAGLASLADRSVDVTISDPPYESEAHTEQRRQKGTCTTVSGNSEFREVNDTPLDFGAITPAQRKDVAAQIARVSRQRAVVFCQAEAIDAWRKAFNAAGMPYRRAMVWIKPDAMPSLHGRWPGQAFESIVVAQHKSARPCPLGGKAKIYTYTRARAGQAGGPGGTQAPHPTTKPLPLMLDLVADFTDPDDLILDPFAGSGTTAIAALMLGRRFVGWERDDNYHAIATRRINGDEAKPRAEQPSLFAAIGGTP
jgi:site-specific DNA-methyltransferase (adenine-specific)